MSPLLQPVDHILLPEILSCPPTTSVYEAARLMMESHCGSIIVMDEAGTALGIWTETDALNLDFSMTTEADGTPVAKVMSSPVRTLQSGTSIHDATGFFRRHGIRHALVERDGRYLGLLSLTDIVLNQGTESFLGLKRLEELGCRPACVLGAELGLKDAVKVMRQGAVDAVGVCFADGELGILTRRDVVRLLAQGECEHALGAVCSRPMLTMAENTSLLHARRLMLQHKIRHLGVCGADGGLKFILGFGDILHNIEHECLLELQGALNERDQALLLSRQSLLLADKVFESTLEGIAITDGAGIIQSVNPAFERITGYSAQESVGKTPALLKSGKQPPEFYEHLWHSLKRDGVWQGEVINRRKNGLLYTEHLSITGIRGDNGEYAHYVAVFSDITQRKQAEERLHFLANHDALTGLPNRTLFLERLEAGVEQAREFGQRMALLFIDLDRFKLVNDTLGHHAGDELLVWIAEEMRKVAPPLAMVARLSGDEFTLLMPAVDSVQQVASRAQSVLDAIAGETVVAGQEVFVSASIGISMFPEDGASADVLLVNADTAMYRAKERGKSNFQFYTPDMNASALERLRLEYSLHKALAQDELEVWYQPKVELATGRLDGAEALIRWRHPELGLVSPARFIPIAEDSSLIVPIGEWVLKTACRQVREWRERRLFGGRVAVNVSGRQLKFAGVVELVERTLEECGLPSSALELEITESVAMDEDSGMVEVLRRLYELGVYLSIDDFGTGYSSLSYLKRLPVQGLKIDQSFVADLHQNRDDAAITQAIISIARSLGLGLVAEGVELDEQRRYLVEQGCGTGQGYLFSRPLPAAEFEALLEREYLAGG
ncbi:diguanylate cyclase/phosphodiesterase with PAS sensor(s) [Pseudogulbenkiania sp. NH8B]|uniref:EAL domain-containing protein n=1 Tax=Pseudogulbenkiania sp. (strain NH8B) TaxID=748280 RepID=UPI0002279F36|nr:EAL domain-containing protein [Pseudogulbenkiania sp. NH8B]BAK76145.1 diguanylate cyclase/phosphodiesterase with PAS sensor(s) [Pseudogulbenkiania sp. NH8B]